MQMICKSLTETKLAATHIIQQFGNEKIWAFFGEMGAGKTTLIKALCFELGVNETVLSPTFSIVNEYALPKGRKIFHFDFYRLNSLSEAYDMGYEEYFYSGEYCFIEWSEKIIPLLPTSFLKIELTVLNEQERMICINAICDNQ